MSDTHLWDAKHPYYCEEGQYFSSQSSSQTIWPFKSWAEFIEEMGDADMDYNMLFRWDWEEPEEDENGESIPAFNGDPYYRNGKLKLYIRTTGKRSSSRCASAPATAVKAHLTFQTAALRMASRIR